ncbi:LysR family transcriptional regulator [Psychromonas sp. psych-6C06]|uniref:LysR family transcriptional regulator n=1 Tax=Psychromonas sp. psych-6C06 TaxID=2058089 RepID=UPI00187BD7E1|nr:LysR family transcriptional regulator [Psychromonas sp. psych-6C06]
MSSNQIDLNLLRVFLEVYRLNSITLAAEALDSTQPAVSGILKRLSKQLGQTLFIREGRGIAPTNVAVQLANDIGPLYVGVDNALDNLKSFDIQHPRTFNVFVTEPMMLLLQPLVDTDSTMGACRINFQLAPNAQTQLLEKLSRQQSDLAIDFGSVNHPSYQTKHFHRDQLIITCSEKHNIIQGEISLSQFYEAEHVRLKMRRTGVDGITAVSKIPLKERQIMADCDSIISGLALASNSNILCVAPRSMSLVYAPLFKLQALTLPFATHPLEHYMIWHKRTEKSKAHQWLRNKLFALITQKAI